MNTSLPTQTYTFAYFKRHVRSFFQAGIKSSMASGCTVLGLDQKPYLLVTPYVPEINWDGKHKLRRTVSLQKLIDYFDDLSELLYDEDGNKLKLIVMHHGVNRYVVSFHPDYKSPEEKPYANDDAAGAWTQEQRDKLLDLESVAEAIRSYLQSAIRLDGSGELTRRDEVLAAVARRAGNLQRGLAELGVEIEEVAS